MEGDILVHHGSEREFRRLGHHVHAEPPTVSLAVSLSAGVPFGRSWFVLIEPRTNSRTDECRGPKGVVEIVSKLLLPVREPVPQVSVSSGRSGQSKRRRIERSRVGWVGAGLRKHSGAG